MAIWYIWLGGIAFFWTVLFIFQIFEKARFPWKATDPDNIVFIYAFFAFWIFTVPIALLFAAVALIIFGLGSVQDYLADKLRARMKK